MIWSVAMLVVGAFHLGMHGRKESGEVRVGDDDLLMLFTGIFLFLTALPYGDIIFFSGILLWVAGMIIRFDRATVWVVSVNKETGEINHGRVLLHRNGPQPLTWTGEKPDLQYGE